MKKKPNYDLEVSEAIVEWMNYTRTHYKDAPLEYRIAIKDAHANYIEKPCRDTAAEVVTLVRFYMEKPVP